MGLSPWKCWRLWQRQMSPLSEAGPSESPWSHASCRSWLPFLLHEQSLEPQEEGSGGPGWKHHDDCEHKRSRQWQKLNWIRLNHTIKGFMQLHFCISVTPFLHFWNVYQHLWNVYQQKDPTELLWSKKRETTMETKQRPWKPWFYLLKNMETNQKPWKNMKLPWKTWKPTKNHEKPWNHLEKPWKPTKNHETTLKNHGNQGGGRALQEKRKNVTHAGSQLTSEMGEEVGRCKTWHNWPFRCLDFFGTSKRVMFELNHT